MFASLRYVQTHHSYATIEGQPDQNPHPPPAPPSHNAGPAAVATTNGTSNANEGKASDAPQGDAQNAATEQEQVPDHPEVFQAALRELARDLVMKEQQIEYLISVLPGIGTSERDQNARIQALEVELREVEEEGKTAAKEKDGMLDMLGQLVANCKRVY